MANRSAAHRIGSSQPAEAPALPTACSIIGTAAIPKPGMPVLAMPTKRAATAATAQLQAGRLGSTEPRCRERRQIQAGLAAGDELGDELGGDGGEQDTVAVVPRGQHQPLDTGAAEH